MADTAATQEETAPSERPGMGAIPYDGGTLFRVWAPAAQQVFVVGDFNEWNGESTPMASEENGYWSVDVPGATPGQGYKYRLINGEQDFFRIDPYAREVTNSTGNSVIHDPAFDWGDHSFQMPSWNELVIYELHVGTFNNTKEGDGPGNFYGVIEGLPYLRDLGVNVIQVMPPMEFAGSFSWGYNPALIFAIESDYGGAKAFKELVKAAHQHGIAVIFDVVYNHLGPSDLDLWQFDGWSENDKGGIYFYNDWRAETPWGETRPDYGREEVRRYLRDNAMMWLEEFQVDGLRWDAVSYIRNVNGKDDDEGADLPEGWSLMRWIHEEIQGRMPWKISIAEDLQQNPWITKSVGEGGAGFNAQWDPSFVHPVRDILTAMSDDERNLESLAHALTTGYSNNPFERLIYTESHDEVANGKARVPHEIDVHDPGSWAARKRSTLGGALVMTTPGIPMIFQGQEFLEDEWFHDTKPLQWERVEWFGGILSLYRDLISLRRNGRGNTAGLRGANIDILHLDNDAKVLAFHRWDTGGPGDSTVVVVNLSSQPIKDYRIALPMGGMWRNEFNSDWSGYSPDFGNMPGWDIDATQQPYGDQAFSGDISIAPYSVLIYSKE